jgi:uncharacterized protein YceK
MRNATILLTVTLGMSGCSTEHFYNYLSFATRPNCGAYNTTDERSRCMRESDRSYESYEKDRSAAQNSQRY